MIFGFEPGFPALINSGMLLFFVLVFQALVGKRTIRFKGRTHAKVHKYAGYALVAGGGLHGLLALVVYNGWRIGG
ncbi:MAG: hypothetical protein U1E29_02350 [Coriobacteriia bacterium]|jgi:hypothetical protein|nr:hypothetical protein [Coriobacteriia bacterium]